MLTTFSISQRRLSIFWEGSGWLEVPLITGTKENFQHFRQLLTELDDGGADLSSVNRLGELVNGKRRTQGKIEGETHDIWPLTKEQTRELVGFFSDNKNINKLLEPKHPDHVVEPQLTQLMYDHSESPKSLKFVTAMAVTVEKEDDEKRKYKIDRFRKTKIDYSSIFNSIKKTFLDDIFDINQAFSILHITKTFEINESARRFHNPNTRGIGRRYGRELDVKIHKVRDEYGVKLDLEYLPPDSFRIETTDGKLLREAYDDLKELKETHERARDFTNSRSDLGKLSSFMDGLLKGDYLMTYNYNHDLCMAIPGEFKEYLNDDRRLRPEMKLVLRYCVEEMKRTFTTIKDDEHLRNLLTVIGWDCELLVDYSLF
jgi:hypothetical protein